MPETLIDNRIPDLIFTRIVFFSVATLMVGEFLTARTLSHIAVNFPGFAHFTAGALISGFTAFMIHSVTGLNSSSLKGISVLAL